MTEIAVGSQHERVVANTDGVKRYFAIVVRCRQMTRLHHRKVRSFVQRAGRTTAAQKRALSELLPRFGIPYQDRTLELRLLFGRRAPVILDIGFGDGSALLTLAANHPDRDYLGVEVHEPGIGHLLLQLERAGLGNIRIIDHDAVEVVRRMLPAGAVDAVNLFFPDPWPKKRHHKRRIVQPGFVRDIARALKPGGTFHIATDWADYAEHVTEVMGDCGQFEALTPGQASSEPLFDRPTSKFERRGIALGHTVTDLHYRRTG